MYDMYHSKLEALNLKVKDLFLKGRLFLGWDKGPQECDKSLITVTNDGEQNNLRNFQIEVPNSYSSLWSSMIFSNHVISDVATNIIISRYLNNSRVAATIHFQISCYIPLKITEMKMWFMPLT